MHIYNKNNFDIISAAGKITIISVVIASVIFFTAAFINFDSGALQKAGADNVNTSVTVLNTAPNWTVDAEEQAESSTANPTNSGSNAVFVGTATDSNGQSYYLLVCKTSGAPTANAGAAPACNGGAGNQWAVSALSPSGNQAVATYTTSNPDAESNDWYAWVCDADSTLPKCNTAYKQGSGNTASPFVVNHRPAFTVFSDDSPKNPGQLVTWTTTASDSDTNGGNDQVKLFVCKANDFTGTDCGAGGAYGTSVLSASNPTATFTLENPKQDKDYTAYGFVLDNHNFAATGGAQGIDSVLAVANVAPTISESTISLLDADEVGSLTLTTANGETTGLKVKFTVTDSNSCQNSVSGDETVSAIANVFRSDIGSASCQIGGDYNANSCYPATVGTGMWNLSCAQDIGSCSGASDSDSTWTCTFPLWHIASPTDGSSLTDSTWFASDWRAAVRATDDNSAFSSLVEGTTNTNEVLSFLSYNVTTASISFGSLEPGQLNDPIDKTTVVQATGNVGLDETLYGLGMCTTFPSCSGDPADTIPVGEQRYAASSVAYASGASLLADPGAEFELNVSKSTSTSTPASSATFWGIRIPVAITLAGSYTGQNTIIGIKGEAQNW